MTKSKDELLIVVTPRIVQPLSDASAAEGPGVPGSVPGADVAGGAIAQVAESERAPGGASDFRATDQGAGKSANVNSGDSKRRYDQCGATAGLLWNKRAL